jgi:hypothetical protein
MSFVVPIYIVDNDDTSMLDTNFTLFAIFHFQNTFNSTRLLINYGMDIGGWCDAENQSKIETFS